MSLLQQLSDGEFTLPEKWCVRVTKDNVEILEKWRDYCYGSLSIGPLGYLLSDKIWFKMPYPGYTEITFDQFKKYVLKEDEVKLNIEVGCEVKVNEDLVKSIYDSNPKDKYAVMITDSGAPTKLHETYESAEAECLRLVEKNKRNGYVLKVCAEIKLEPKINKLCQQ